MPADLDRDDMVGIWTAHPTLAKGTWKDGDEWYKVRPISPGILQHFDKQSLRPWKNPDTRQVEMKRDDDIYNQLLWDHAIEDWRLLNAAGEPWPCTLDNKLKLAAKYADRVKVIVDTGIDYANNDAARIEAEERSFRVLREAEAGFAMAPVQ